MPEEELPRGVRKLSGVTVSFTILILAMVSCQNLPNCTFSICAVYYMSLRPQFNKKKKGANVR